MGAKTTRMFFSRLIRTFFYSLVGVLLLLLILAAVSQTGIFRSWALTKIVEISKENLNGSLAIERLSGNLVSTLQLDNVVLKMGDKTVAIVERLRAEYNPFGLLAGKIVVRKITVVAPRLWLERDRAGEWNVTRLALPDSLESQDDAKSSRGNEWQIAMPHIEIKSGSAYLDSSDARALAAPQRLKNLDLQLGLWLEKNRTRIALEQLNFETEAPAMKVRTAQADLALHEVDLKASTVEIATERSKLTSRLDIKNLDEPFLEMRVSAAPLSLEEVRRVVPELVLYGDPRIDLEARGPLDALALKAGIRWGQGIINLNGQVAVGKAPFSYDLDCRVAHLNLHEISNDWTLSSDLNFGVRASGTGLEPGEMLGAATVTVDSSVFAGTAIGGGTLTASLESDTLELNLQAAAEGAQIALQATSSGLVDTLVYTANATVAHLDLSRFNHDSTNSSDVNFALKLDGSGISMQTLAANVELWTRPSEIAGVEIDSSRMAFRVENETVKIEDFMLRTPFGDGAAHGVLALAGSSHLAVELDRLNFSNLGLLAGIDSLAGGGTLRVTVSGPTDSLFVRANADLARVSYPGFKLGAGAVVASGHLAKSGVQLEIEGGLLDISTAVQPLDSFAFRIDYFDSFANYHVTAGLGDDFSLSTRGKVEFLSDGYSVTSHEIDVGFLQQGWRQSGVDAVLHIYDDRYQLSPLTLTSEGQQLSLQGTVSTENQNDLQIQLKNIDLSRFRRLLSADDDYVLRGQLSTGLRLTQRLASPRLSGDFRLDDGEYSGVSFDALHGDFGYADGQANWTLAIAKTRQDSLFRASARFPVTLSLAPYEQTLAQDGEVEFKLSTRGIEIAFLQPFITGMEDLSGILEADVVIKNTLRDLRGVGHIRLVNGGFRLPDLGTHYTKINLVVVADDKTLQVRDFSMRSGSGYLRALEGSLALSEDRLENFASKVKLRNFQLVNNKKMKARASGEIEFSGSLMAPVFQGELTIDESRIFYQQLEEETAVALTSQPFFVIVSDSAAFDSTGALRFQKADELKENSFLESRFFNNLTGELSIDFPRNAWVRSPDASIEVEGDVAALKPRGPNFALFGSFSTLRGFYELLGNRFQVDRGEMVFHGEPEINPEVAIAATTTIVDGADGVSPEKREFSVQVGGTLLFPEFSFTLDGDVASQEDIVSILLFGQTSQDLAGNLPGGGTESNGSNSGINERAKGLLAGQLLKQLSGRLGQQLSLDVIQIESGGSLADSKVRVGKYIAPEVFVSWSQDFGADGNQLVELEYELPLKLRFLKLLLQASSDRQGDTGLDVIWKFEW